MVKKTKIVRTRKSVTIMYDGGSIIVNENHGSLYESVIQILDKYGTNEQGLQQAIELNFSTWEKKLQAFSSNTIQVVDNRLTLKGTNVPVPQPIVKALKQLQANGSSEGFIALIRFWKKLSKNPSKNSREQLYDFIEHNDMSITNTGDLVFEKGVSITDTIDEFVDAHNGTVSYVMGEETFMNRQDVVDDANEACAAGLHVAPPSYVRRWYTPSNKTVIVECTVNPIDVVSVPKDYRSSKVRVCRLKVVGYSDQNGTRMKGQIFDLNDFITEAPIDVIKSSKQSTQKSLAKPNKKKASKSESQKGSDIGKMTARQIVEFVQSETGELIVPLENKYLKNKKRIVKLATEALSKRECERVDLDREDQDDRSALQISFDAMTVPTLIDHIKEKYGVTMHKAPKAELVTEAIDIALKHKLVAEVAQDDAVVQDHSDKPEVRIEEEKVIEKRTRALKQVKEIDLSQMKTDTIITHIKLSFNEKIGGLFVSRSKVIARATKILKDAGWKVKS